MQLSFWAGLTIWGHLSIWGAATFVLAMLLTRDHRKAVVAGLIGLAAMALALVAGARQVADVAGTIAFFSLAAGVTRATLDAARESHRAKRGP